MSKNERTVQNDGIEQKINNFADQLEAEYLKEYSDRIANGEQGIDKTSVSNVKYYERFVFHLINNMEMSMTDIYVVDSENNGQHQVKIYKEIKNEETEEVTRVLVATVNEKGEVVFTPDFSGLQNGVSDKNMESILASNEKNEKAELKQETYDLIEEEVSNGEIDKEDAKKQDIKALENESKSKEELKTKIELGIKPGTVQELTTAETREFSEFRGHSVEFGYSKEQPGYIAYDKNTAEVLMGPAIANTRTITKQSAEGEITTERHSEMMQSSSNPNKMITIQIGAYGERILNETDRTSEGDFVARTIDVRGKTQNNKKVREAMNNKETRENMGETAEELNEMGVTTKKNPEWKLSAAELEEFKDKMREQMGPCTEADLMRRFQKAADELNTDEITLGMIIAQAKKDYIEEQQQYNESIRNGEGRGFGEGEGDPRRAI